MTASAFGYSGFIAVAAVAALLASEMVEGDGLAGIPAAAGTLGVAVAAAPLALRSKRRGRRRGIWLGYLIGVIGAGVAVIAGQAGIFWLLVVALFAFGAGNASNLQNRFAAADLAEDERRARSIALVVWVGTIGAVLGPAAALWVNRVGMEAGFNEWVSPMILGVVGFGLAGLVIAAFLRPDPLEVSGGVEPDAPRHNTFRGMSHSWRVIRPNSMAMLAVGAMALSQVAMVAVMTMTPLHMKDYGHAELSTLVIAAHVLGMFGLAPLIGRWADRWGRVKALRVGAIVLGIGTISAVATGYVPVLMFIGLFLLGLGWNFAFIAGSALLTESVPTAERVGAQGLSDVLMRFLGAAAAFSSGFVKSAVGFHWLANFATMAAVLILVGAVVVARSSREVAEVTAG
jgi:MFS family permease